MSIPQSEFNVTLPTTDNAVPPNQLVAGQMTQLDFVVTPAGGAAATYSWPIPAATSPGASVVVPFANTAPPFAPVAGKTYSADCFAVDANGNGSLSGTITWTEAATPTPPAAPTNFGVS
jgi:hypothetical protein